ncbi:MAG: DUF4349 domain-containing protein, partial [Phycisphaeraceae bacterium]|nr:DUF4349 domain-containing protein [Phycisphaeraceae bacterium]
LVAMGFALGIVVSLGIALVAFNWDEWTGEDWQAMRNLGLDVVGGTELVYQVEVDHRDHAAHAERIIDQIEESQRHMIHRGSFTILVDDFEPVPNRVAELVQRFGGYVAESRIDVADRRSRRGEWTVRVPVDQYEAFTAAASELGQLAGVRSSREEVTERYVDLESRIRNQRRQEERLLKHLESTEADLEGILHIERELARVRESLESLEGRHRVLRDQIRMATVTLTVREMRAYATQPTEVPALGVRMGRAWSDSLSALVEFGKRAMVVAAQLTPWIVVMVIIIVPLVGMIRWMRRRRPHIGTPRPAAG